MGRVFDLESKGVWTSRTAIKALQPINGTTVYLTEFGREGLFAFRSGNYATQIAADVYEGMYLKADTIAASAGAFVRVIDGPILAQWFGAVDDGTTDVGARINSIFSVAPWGSEVRLTIRNQGTYYTTTTINVAAGFTLTGGESGGEGTDGVSTFVGAVEILGALALTPIVDANGGGGSASVNVSNLMIRRASGTVPAGSIGLLVRNTNNALISDVVSMRSAKGIRIYNSLAVALVHCNTFTISDTHIELETAFEITIIDTRMGRNGGFDVLCNSYLRSQERHRVDSPDQPQV